MLSRLLSIVLLLAMFRGYAQQAADKLRLETRVRFTKVSIDEEIEVAFVFHGGELKAFDKPDLSDFIIVRGPMQSTSRMTTMEHGVEETKMSVTMTYMLKAPKTGVFKIGKAKAKTADGGVYYSQSVDIEVAGKNEVIERTGNYPSLEKDMNGFLSRTVDMEAPYLIATGPLFYHKGAKPKKTPAALMKDVKSALSGISQVQEIGIYVWDSTKPRVYIGMKDTSHAQEVLAQLYAGYGDGQYYTKIDTRGSFIFGESAGTLRGMRDYYLGFENMKPWLLNQGRDTLMPRRLYYTWIFTHKANRDAFNNRVAMRGYAIDSLHEEGMKYDRSANLGAGAYRMPMNGGDRAVIFYSVTISQVTELKDEVMWRKADQLLEIAESLEATFGGMTVEKDKK
jgi:hypothetical protein